MPRHAALAAILALLAAPALAGGFAAPVVVPAPAAPAAPVAPPAPSADWTGFYLGGQLGFGSTINEDQLSLADDLEDEGRLFGVHAGYQFDLGSVVAGAELDWDRTNIVIGENATDDGTLDPDDRVNLDSVARAKVRLGFDAGRLLPYVTAGVARAAVSADFLDVEDSYDGRFVGLGAAYAISDRFTVGVEALRHDFEDLPFTDFDTELDTLTLRGSFSF